MDTKLVKTVAMFGPSIREPWKIVNRDVPERDVPAYKAAGYQVGSIPEVESPAIVEPTESVEPAVVAAKPKGRGKK